MPPLVYVIVSCPLGAKSLREPLYPVAANVTNCSKIEIKTHFSVMKIHLQTSFKRYRDFALFRPHLGAKLMVTYSMNFLNGKCLYFN